MTDILLDSDVVINLLKKNEETVQTMQGLGECVFWLSPIVVAEVLAGARPKEIAQIETLFGYFETVAIDTDTGTIAGNYANRFRKAYHTISLEDYLIAATAKQHNLQLWTYNTKHYPMKDIVLI